MRIVAAVVALILFALFLNEYVPPVIYSFIGKNLTEDTRPFSRQIPESDISILIVGDSTALGVGASGPDKSFAGLVGNKYRNTSIVNEGEGGADFGDTIEQLQKHDGEDFYLTIIMTGGNEVLGIGSVDKARKKLKSLLTEARLISTYTVFFPAGNIGHAPVMPLGIAQYYSSRAKDFHEMYLIESYKQGVVLVDIFREKKVASSEKGLYAIDQLHPSDEGYKNWFDAFEKKINENSLSIE